MESCGRRALGFGRRVHKIPRRARAARKHALRDHAGDGGGQLLRESDRALAAAGGNRGVVSAAAALGRAARPEDGPGSRPHRLQPGSVARTGELSARRWNAGPPERLCAGARLHDAQRRDRRIRAGSLAAGEGMAAQGLLLEPGCASTGTRLCAGRSWRRDFAAVYAPPGDKDKTKISAGIGLYYEHTQLEYLAQTFAGVRYDTYYQADGVTPSGPAENTEFTANQGCVARAARAQLERGCGARVAVVDHGRREFHGEAHHGRARVCRIRAGAAALAGDYLLTNGREDRYSSEEFDARRLFANGYTVYLSYTHSSARTNAALDYLPTPSPLGAQQSGPLRLGHAESRHLLGMAAGSACDAEKAVGCCLFARLAQWISVHGGECGPAGGGRGGSRSAFRIM